MILFALGFASAVACGALAVFIGACIGESESDRLGHFLDEIPELHYTQGESHGPEGSEDRD